MKALGGEKNQGSGDVHCVGGCVLGPELVGDRLQVLLDRVLDALLRWCAVDTGARAGSGGTLNPKPCFLYVPLDGFAPPTAYQLDRLQWLAQTSEELGARDSAQSV